MGKGLKRHERASHIIVLAALGHTFVLEQPGSAKFGDMPRWQFFCQKICYDFQLQYAVSSCLQELGN